MGIMDFFRAKQTTKSEEKEEKTIVKEKPFVSDISMFELEDADWRKFAGILKRDGILANSYKKQPKEMQVSLDENNRPMVRLTFESATSSSVRELELFQDTAYQYINGVLSSGDKGKELINAWHEFQKDIRYVNMLDTNRNGNFNKIKGDRLIKVAMKMQKMDDIYDREQEFLKKYKDSSFGELTYSYLSNPPMFIEVTTDARGVINYGEAVIPFTPKTLEFCISRMTDNFKIEQGLFLREFENRCKDIAEFSCYDSPNWEKVISNGKEMIKAKYLASEWGREIER